MSGQGAPSPDEALLLAYSRWRAQTHPVEAARALVALDAAFLAVWEQSRFHYDPERS